MFLNRAAYLCLKIFPKELLSRIMGKISDARFPKFILIPMILVYSWIFGVNMAESEKSAPEFGTFNDFFTRKLKSGSRKIAAGKRSIISPVDGKVLNFGKIDGSTLIQAKGKEYTLENLLQDKNIASEFNGGSFITIYLHPRDYHRIHAPVYGKISGFSYIPGALFPVNSLSLNSVDELFPRNERLITYIESPRGKIAVVKVGACLVGRIRANYAGFISDSSIKKSLQKEFLQKISVKKGEEIGMFELGSTVILIFQNKRVKFGKLKSGERILMGDEIACAIV